MSIRCCALSKVHTLSTVEAILRCFSFSAQGDQGTRTAAGGFDPIRAAPFLHWLTRAHELPQAGLPLTGSSFLHRLAGAQRTAAGGFDPTGSSFSAPADRGTRTASGVFRPIRAGSFSLNLSGGIRRLRTGDVAAPAAGTAPYPRRRAWKGHLRFPFLF